jgi:formylglycine-generating enzyme required for sulfatase activity
MGKLHPWGFLASLLVFATTVCGQRGEAGEPGKDSALAVAPFDAAAAEKYQGVCAGRLNRPVELTNSIGMKLVLIPAGEFTMGSPEDEVEKFRRFDRRFKDEAPHRVRISRPFYLGACEVTQDQYRRVMGENPSYFSKAGRAGSVNNGLPVERVSWEDAVEFCRRLSELAEEKQAGRKYRLPTEAEWEYACRAGTTSAYHFGVSCNGGEANCDGSLPFMTPEKGTNLASTTGVRSYAPNAWGLFDMHGNVSEWCADWYDADYYSGSPPKDPQGPKTGRYRVIRGGCWCDRAVSCRSADRDRARPDSRTDKTGIRVAITGVR